MLPDCQEAAMWATEIILDEFENGDYFPAIDEESKRRYISILQQDKIDLDQFFKRYHRVL